MTSQVTKVQVFMVNNEEGQERIALKVVDAEDACVTFTPAQARALATELITAVNRAEIKTTLKVSPTPWKRTTDPIPHRFVAAR